MAKHWSEILECQCGKRFRSYAAESVHRHNFPVLCRRPPDKYEFLHGKRKVTVATRDGLAAAEVLARRELDRRMGVVPFQRRLEYTGGPVPKAVAGK